MRRTVRVEFARKSPQDILLLVETILEQHSREGAGSPVPKAVADELRKLLGRIEPLKKKADLLRAQSQELTQQVYTLIGIAEGQTNEVAGTVMFLVTEVREELLRANRGNEEALSKYGFDVVIGGAASPAREGESEGEETP